MDELLIKCRAKLTQLLNAKPKTYEELSEMTKDLSNAELWVLT